MPSDDAPTQTGNDPLLELQLRVARRADELAVARPRDTFNLICWLLAEQEIFVTAGLGSQSSGAPSPRR